MNFEETEFEPLRGKKIGPNAQKKLMQIMD